MNQSQGDAVAAWAEVHRLRAAVAGPEGYATWRDAATDERVKRLAAEREIGERDATIARLREDAGLYFDAGWATAANWAGRSDLIADMDSAPFLTDKTNAINAIDTARRQSALDAMAENARELGLNYDSPPG